MKLRSPTDEPIQVALTTGHTAVIAPEGTEVDAMFVRDAIKRGAIPCGGAAHSDLQLELDNRQSDIREALEASTQGTLPNLMGRDGKPDLRKLIAKVGFEVHRSEMDAAWAEIQSA